MLPGPVLPIRPGFRVLDLSAPPERFTREVWLV